MTVISVRESIDKVLRLIRNTDHQRTPTNVNKKHTADSEVNPLTRQGHFKKVGFSLA